MLKLQLKQSELESIKFMRDNKLVSLLLYVVKVLIYAYPIFVTANTITDNSLNAQFKIVLSLFFLLPILILFFRDIARIVIMHTFDIIEVKDE